MLLLLTVLVAGAQPLDFAQATTQAQSDDEQCATFLRLNYLVEPLGKYVCGSSLLLNTIDDSSGEI